MTPDLRVDLAGVRLPNPVLTAAGCAGTGRELALFTDVSRLGAVVTKSLMSGPRAGTPVPRVAETPSGVLSAIGLQGPGLEVFLDRDLPWLVSQGARAVVSIAGGSPDEYAELAQRLDGQAGVTAVEVNLASANQADHGRYFVGDRSSAVDVVRAVRAATGLPVFAKLSSAMDSVGGTVALAEAVVEAGADVLSMINSVRGMVVDTTTARPALAGAAAGLSGPAIRPIALATVHDVHQALPQVPVIGMGGIHSGDDALQFVLAGASAVGVGTASLHDPGACGRILRELTGLLEERGWSRISDVVGRAHDGAPLRTGGFGRPH
ncbi:dihydroorotate dehydrogenase [Lipingzhangella sp. LS1_29]|uniref:Dihydroorotate dehydrogenase n=1 Tax=Lipingzhangella rawalii TaxID=2055835 RepID=A0ABU2H2E9_9ACTN|nr:dihydroorotate dehydrogenase [Lipingzhangella rawalii]MDS1269467.1 dihydroorotate dehydrogenase [Lipingzhangella rawalii]